MTEILVRTADTNKETLFKTYLRLNYSWQFKLTEYQVTCKGNTNINPLMNHNGKIMLNDIIYIHKITIYTYPITTKTYTSAISCRFV